MQDGTPVHYSQPVRDVLSSTYRDKSIVTARPNTRYPHSRDHNLSDFYLWRNLKMLVYSAPVQNEERLCRRILYAYQTIHNRPGTCEMARQLMMRHVHTCIYSGGRDLDYLLSKTIKKLSGY